MSVARFARARAARRSASRPAVAPAGETRRDRWVHTVLDAARRREEELSEELSRFSSNCASEWNCY